MIKLHLLFLLLTLAAMTEGGCASIEEYEVGNGERGVFDLRAGPFSSACGNTPAPPPSVCTEDHRCWMLALAPGRYELEAARRIRIADCNGLGDCSRGTELRSVGDVASAKIEIVPSGAAVAEAVTDCSGRIRFTLAVVRATDFDLTLSIGSRADTWAFRAVADCTTQAFDCSVYQFPQPELPPRCCGYASNPAR